jgi:hypothetical protein
MNIVKLENVNRTNQSDTICFIVTYDTADKDLTHLF